MRCINHIISTPTQRIFKKFSKRLPREEFKAMAKHKTRDQIIVRISLENGVPREQPLTAKEQRQFTKTHPNLKLPTFTLEEINRIAMSDPSTISVVDEPSAR